METLLTNTLKQWFFENQRTIVQTLLTQLGPEGKRDLIAFFAATDPNFLWQQKSEKTSPPVHLITKNGERLDHSLSERTLNTLGVQVFHPQESNVSVWDVPATKQLIRINQNEVPKRHDKKSLLLLLSEDIPDIKNREMIIDLFFLGQGYQRQTDVFLLDILRRIDTVLDRNWDHTHNIIPMGETQKAVEQKKQQVLGTLRLHNMRRTSESKDCVLIGDFKQVVENNSKQNDDEALFYYVVQQKEHLTSFVQSTFCFCVSQLAQIPENIAWAVAPEKVSFTIPSWVQQKMQLLTSISVLYDIQPSYAPLLQGATRAFIRVHNGI